MIRPILGLAALGAAGLLAWQLLWGLLVPFAVGLLALVLKLAFWAVVIGAAIWLFRKLSAEQGGEA